jgi:hypothetical protein
VVVDVPLCYLVAMYKHPNTLAPLQLLTFVLIQSDAANASSTVIFNVIFFM